MPKYMITARYSQEGMQGLLQEGAASRVENLKQVVASMGGKTEGFYYGLGAEDGYAIVELPDNVSAVTIPMMVRASGAAEMTLTPLLTQEEIDAAIQKGVSYRPPGQ